MCVCVHVVMCVGHICDVCDYVSIYLRCRDKKKRAPLNRVIYMHVVLFGDVARINMGQKDCFI